MEETSKDALEVAKETHATEEKGAKEPLTC
jgi:hypothetical protein